MSERIWPVIVEVRLSVQDADPLAARRYAEKYVAGEGFTFVESYIEVVDAAIGGDDEE